MASEIVWELAGADRDGGNLFIVGRVHAQRESHDAVATVDCRFREDGIGNRFGESMASPSIGERVVADSLLNHFIGIGLVNSEVHVNGTVATESRREGLGDDTGSGSRRNLDFAHMSRQLVGAEGGIHGDVTQRMHIQSEAHRAVAFVL